MKYLQISNKGLIEPEALTLIGASSKRGDTSKIGMFGSGNKYALAYFFRNNYNLQIFTNGDRVRVGTVKKTFREAEYDVLTVEGVETSITTDMGHKWKLWQAIREFYSNATDEGLTAFCIVDEIKPRPGHTDLFIEVNEGIQEFMDNMMDYIGLHNIILDESEVGKIYLKHGKKTCVYRKGIRCYDTLKESLFDYDLYDIGINEDRIVEYYWNMNEAIMKMLFTTPEVEIVKIILEEVNGDVFEKSVLSDSISTKPTIENQDVWRQALNGRYVCPEGFMFLVPKKHKDMTLGLPSEFCNMLIKQVPGVKMPFSLGQSGRVSYLDHEMTALQLDTLKRVEYFFKECNFRMPYEVKVVRFTDPDLYGTIEKELILISDICLDKGPHEVANTLIEEAIHIKYNAADESRKFQTCLIDEFLTYMKNQNTINI
jgi:hypothetical protein